MRWRLYLLWLTAFPMALCRASEADDTFLLQKIYIEGNTVTDERFIERHLTLEEGKVYELDDLIDEMNRSRKNIEKTGLFSSIFFHDEIDESSSYESPHTLLTIWIKLVERNFLFFGPTGYLGFEEKKWYSAVSLYALYTNVFGNGTRFYSEFPLFQNRGIVLEQSGNTGGLSYRVGFEYRDDYFLEERNWTVLTGIGFTLKEHLSAGMNLHFHNAEAKASQASFTTVFVSPYLESGFHKRYSPKMKRWHYAHLEPFLGYNFTGPSGEADSTFFGVEGGFHRYYDLLLKIVYAVRVEAFAGGGEFPKKYLFYSSVRGTLFPEHSGNYLLSVTNELSIPLPTNPRYVFVPFLDANLIADGKPDFLFGGGIGFSWYTRYQDPLSIDVAFGKGIMVNFRGSIQ